MAAASPLTAREQEIAWLAARGGTSRSVAEGLHLLWARSASWVRAPSPRGVGRRSAFTVTIRPSAWTSIASGKMPGRSSAIMKRSSSRQVSIGIGVGCNQGGLAGPPQCAWTSSDTPVQKVFGWFVPARVTSHCRMSSIR